MIALIQEALLFPHIALLETGVVFAFPARFPFLAGSFSAIL
jgi:hypothetical protein